MLSRAQGAKAHTFGNSGGYTDGPFVDSKQCRGRRR